MVRFEATCNLDIERVASSSEELPEDPVAYRPVKWGRDGQVLYRVNCGFGTTTDRDEFERHMKEAHPERTRPDWLAKLHNPTGSGWKMRPAFKAQTDKPWTKRMEARLVECPSCGTWVESQDDGGRPVRDLPHDCTYSGDLEHPTSEYGTVRIERAGGEG